MKKFEYLLEVREEGKKTTHTVIVVAAATRPEATEKAKHETAVMVYNGYYAEARVVTNTTHSGKEVDDWRVRGPINGAPFNFS